MICKMCKKICRVICQNSAYCAVRKLYNIMCKKYAQKYAIKEVKLYAENAKTYAKYAKLKQNCIL